MSSTGRRCGNASRRSSKSCLIAQSQANEDVENHELCRERVKTRSDRPPVGLTPCSPVIPRIGVAANEHYRTAADTLDRVGLALGQPRGASASLLQQVRDAAHDLDQSEQLAREDIRLAAQRSP